MVVNPSSVTGNSLAVRLENFLALEITDRRDQLEFRIMAMKYAFAEHKGDYEAADMEYSRICALCDKYIPSQVNSAAASSASLPYQNSPLDNVYSVGAQPSRRLETSDNVHPGVLAGAPDLPPASERSRQVSAHFRQEVGVVRSNLRAKSTETAEKESSDSYRPPQRME